MKVSNLLNLLIPWSIQPQAITTNTLSPIPSSLPAIESLYNTTDAFVIDTFHNPTRNDLGYWHGTGEDLSVEYGDGFVRFYPTDPDQNFHTQLSSSVCFSLLPYRNKYLHIVFSGSQKFSISLNQHNYPCDPLKNPYPGMLDTVEAPRYVVKDRRNDIYIPLEHFRVDLSRVVSVSFHGFWTKEVVTVYSVEIVNGLPEGVKVPGKVENGRMVLRCSRENAFAFGIDDGDPRFARQIMDILEEEKVFVTFFVVANGLRDESTNFSSVYREMRRRGHQIALHSDSHPKMEALESIADIDAEITKSIAAFRDILGHKSRYFRPPFGTVAARMRQRLATYINNPFIVNWSVDVEDWLWASSDTPERQLQAFVRDVGKGGNLVVMHYLSPTTVRYFREMIHFVKTMGLDIMRVDQCIEDPEAPGFVKTYS